MLSGGGVMSDELIEALCLYHVALLHLGVKNMPLDSFEFQRWFLSKQGSQIASKAMRDAFPFDPELIKRSTENEEIA